MSNLPVWLNTSGLILNILGVGVVFFFGFPQPSHHDGNLLAWGEDASAAPRRRRYKLLSQLGLALMIAGFALQLAAIWLVPGA